MGGAVEVIEDIAGGVGDIIEGVGDAVGDLVEGVGDVVEKVADTISDAGSWIDDNVLQPALDDPIKTIATIAAIASGNPQFISYINAADVAAKGGDLEDIGKAYIVSEIGRGFGNEVGNTVFQETGSKIAASAAAGATRGAVSTASTGGDPLSAAILGGATGATGELVKMGSEELFGPAKTQTGLEKFATGAASQVARTAVGQEVAEELYDTQGRAIPRVAGQRTKVGTTATQTTGTEQANYETKKYVNDSGNVIYISFKDGEPQQPIPPGYREESLTQTTMLASALPEASTNPLPPSAVSMPAAKGGLASKTKKVKPTTSKGLAAKKK